MKVIMGNLEASQGDKFKEFVTDDINWNHPCLMLRTRYEGQRCCWQGNQKGLPLPRGGPLETRPPRGNIPRAPPLIIPPPPLPRKPPLGKPPLEKPSWYCPPPKKGFSDAPPPCSIPSAP
ncbi:hypothetical protein J437_LFUL014049 [Ladona fulva]|uniref:Uncharacterized protein n=1 Tax=Ladona fulva TaxID=123851 RepID=A0A8K0P5C9_LADFU|nr:hypothetical protein J437_LFUL014049 [Ladona fulva]